MGRRPETGTDQQHGQHADQDALTQRESDEPFDHGSSMLAFNNSLFSTKLPVTTTRAPFSNPSSTKLLSSPCLPRRTIASRYFPGCSSTNTQLWPNTVCTAESGTSS